MLDYLTTLPVELIYKILDNLSLIHIFASVCFVNKRLRSIYLTYPRLQLDFTSLDSSMNKKQFDSICTQLFSLTSQIISLTLFDENDVMTSVKNALFFSRFNIIDKTFPNLRSLTLTDINYETWHLFKSQLPLRIEILSINLSSSHTSISSSMTSDIVNELLFLSPSLQRLSIKMAGFVDGSIKIRSPSNSSTSSSVQYFHLESATIDLLSILVVAPMLRTLHGRFHTPDLKLGIIHPRLLYLKQLWIELCTITWTEMTTLLSLFPQLIDLTIIASNVDSDMANGFTWARLLQSIEHFEFELYFSNHTFEEQPFNLNSFRTKFWLEEKKWFVTYDRSFNEQDSSMLYSNSSSTIIYPPYEIIEMLVSESTSSEPRSFSHIHHLVINDLYLKYAVFYRYTYIKEICLSHVTPTFHKTFKDLVSCIDTSKITICNIDCDWSRNTPYEHMEFLRSLPRLRRLDVTVINIKYLFLHQWPQVIDLTIKKDSDRRFYALSSKDIDALCYSFPNIERLDIYSSSFSDLPQVINRMRMTLTDLILRQPRKVNSEEFITREWIERNTELRNFHYTCGFRNSVKLWL